MRMRWPCRSKAAPLAYDSWNVSEPCGKAMPWPGGAGWRGVGGLSVNGGARFGAGIAGANVPPTTRAFSCAMQVLAAGA